MHTPDLYKFKSSLKQIEDPLEKLDYVIVNAMEASNELGQIEAQQYWGKQIPEEEYEKIYFDYCEFIDWCKEEISCLEDNYPLKIENRKKAAWPGHKILEFPLVWNHEIYNLIEPEVKKAGKKMEWLEWLLIRIEEGPGEYWKFEDHVCNAAYLDYDYYMNRNIGQGDPEEMLHLTGLIKSKFIEERLYLAKEIWSLKSKSRINKKKKQTSVKKKEISDHPVNILAIRTITDRFERGQKISFKEIKNHLKDYTLPRETIEFAELDKGPGVKYYIDKIFQKPMYDSSLRKNVSKMTQILKQGGKLPLPE